MDTDYSFAIHTVDLNNAGKITIECTGNGIEVRSIQRIPCTSGGGFITVDGTRHGGPGADLPESWAKRHFIKGQKLIGADNGIVTLSVKGDTILTVPRMLIRDGAPILILRASGIGRIVMHRPELRASIVNALAEDRGNISVIAGKLTDVKITCRDSGNTRFQCPVITNYQIDHESQGVTQVTSCETQSVCVQAKGSGNVFCDGAAERVISTIEGSGDVFGPHCIRILSLESRGTGRYIGHRTRSTKLFSNNSGERVDSVSACLKIN